MEEVCRMFFRQMDHLPFNLAMNFDIQDLWQQPFHGLLLRHLEEAEEAEVEADEVDILADLLRSIKTSALPETLRRVCMTIPVESNQQSTISYNIVSVLLL